MSRCFTWATLGHVAKANRSVYLLSDKGENCPFFFLTDADGIQDLTSRFLHLTSLREALQLTRVFILSRAGGNQSSVSFLFPTNQVLKRFPPPISDTLRNQLTYGVCNHQWSAGLNIKIFFFLYNQTLPNSNLSTNKNSLLRKLLLHEEWLTTFRLSKKWTNQVRGSTKAIRSFWKGKYFLHSYASCSFMGFDNRNLKVLKQTCFVLVPSPSYWRLQFCL